MTKMSLPDNLQVEQEYGYVVLVALSSFLLNFWQVRHISKLRKKLGIPYPQMTSDKHHEFNCAQRVHLNTLELLPFFFTNLLVGSIRHPKYAAIFGTVFIVGRVIYSIGYWTGDINKRGPGGVISLVGAMLPLFGLAVSSGAGILGIW